MRLSERGLTLIEMVVVIGCLGVMAAVVSAIFVQGMSTYSAGQAAGLVVSDIRFAVDQMSMRLREARSGSIIVNPAKDQVTLEVWNAATNSYSAYTYRQSGQDIQVNGQPMCSYVQTLRFDLDVAKKEITITVTTVSSIPGARLGTGLPMTFSTRVALRNY